MTPRHYARIELQMDADAPLGLGPRLEKANAVSFEFRYAWVKCPRCGDHYRWPVLSVAHAVKKLGGKEHECYRCKSTFLASVRDLQDRLAEADKREGRA